MKIHFKKFTWKQYILAGVAFFVIFFVGSVEYTSRPSFCPTCHYMEPFYDSWQESSHKSVNCTECHYAPGMRNKIRGKMEGLVQVVKYVSRAYLRSKPWAEIPDESCLRSGCHQTHLLHGEEEFKGVHFDHKPHLTELRRGKKLRCTSCHSQIVQGTHMVVTESSCFICHFKYGSDNFEKLRDCRLCHTDSRMIARSQSDELRYDHTEVVNQKMNCQQCHGQTIIGNGQVNREQCFTCHWENERLARFNETDFLHKMHITENKIECFQCHNMIQHQISHKDVEVISECQSCHVGTHAAQKHLFTGTGGVDVPDRPNMMYDIGLNCRGCHILHGKNDMLKESGEDLYVANQKACESCHGAGFGKLMLQWEKMSDAKVKEISSIRQNVMAQLRTKSMTKDIQQLMDDADKNIELVKAGKSVHNVAYADELLNKAYDKFNEALDMADITYQLPSFKETTAHIPSDCAVCHISVQPNDIHVFNVEFSHQRHVILHDIQCQKCHSNLRKHGELILTRDKCLTCHHQEQKDKRCQDCHDEAYAVFSGKIKEISNASPDIMFENDLDCYSCHSGEGGKIERPTSQVCIDCHDNEYGKTLLDWKNDNRNSLMEIKKIRDEIKVNALNATQKNQLEKIDELLKILQVGGGQGVHNHDLLSDTLIKIKSQLQQLK